MPASNSSRLAKLLAHATGDSYQTSLRTVESAAASGRPLFAEPEPSQEQLEGAVFGKMAELRWKSSDGSTSFGIKRVVPATDHLIIELDRGSDITDFVVNLMPVNPEFPEDPNAEVSGIPGLRARGHRLGVSLFRPGQEGEIIIKGVSAKQWEAAHEAGFSAPHDDVHCAATASPNQWTAAEQEFDAWRRRRFGDEILQREAEDNVLQSAVFRRIGLINRMSPAGVSTWKSIDQIGVVIEILRDGSRPAEDATFLKEITSPMLSPQFTVTGRSGGRYQLSTTRNDRVLEIRIARA